MGLRLEAAARGRIKTISASNPPQPHASPQALRVLKMSQSGERHTGSVSLATSRRPPPAPSCKRGEDNLALGVLQVLIERHAI